MQRKDALTILRDQVIASEGHQATPGMKAIGFEEALKRGGYAIVSNEVLGLLAVILYQGYVATTQLDQLLQTFGLAKIVPFDPEKHRTSEFEQPPVGAPFMEYSQDLRDARDRANFQVMGTVH